jgi:hypothetical protein
VSLDLRSYFFCFLLIFAVLLLFCCCFVLFCLRGRRVFSANLLRRRPDPSDRVNHLRLVDTHENEHSFWMYNRVDRPLDTVQAIKDGLGLGLRRRCVCACVCGVVCFSAP